MYEKSESDFPWSQIHTYNKRQLLCVAHLPVKIWLRVYRRQEIFYF